MNYVEYFSNIKEQLVDAPADVKKAFNTLVKYFSNSTVYAVFIDGEEEPKSTISIDSKDSDRDIEDKFYNWGKSLGSKYKNSEFSLCYRDSEKDSDHDYEGYTEVAGGPYASSFYKGVNDSRK